MGLVRGTGLALAVYAVVELLAYAAHLVWLGEPFSFAASRELRAGIRASSRGAGADAPEPFRRKVLHPDLGYVQLPAPSNPLHPFNIHGFPGRDDWTDASPALTVAITGGSLAERLFRDGREALLERLREAPRYRDRPLRAISLANSAYKQPQQLMAVAYYLALGGRIDVLVNLDGFNEIDSTWKLAARGIFPAYPLIWHQLTPPAASPEYLATAGELNGVARLRGDLANAADAVAWSVLANVVWRAADRLLERRAGTLQWEIERFAGEEPGALPYYRSGPTGTIGEGDLPAFSARLWADASLQIQRLADGNGFAYFHFLQPNPHVPDSKRLTPEEIEAITRDGVRGGGSYGLGARRGYPLLREAGEDLRRHGEAFYDLTDLFADVDETLYVDLCCHVNPRGSEILARRIGAVVAEQPAP